MVGALQPRNTNAKQHDEWRDAIVHFGSAFIGILAPYHTPDDRNPIVVSTVSMKLSHINFLAPAKPHAIWQEQRARYIPGQQNAQSQDGVFRCTGKPVCSDVRLQKVSYERPPGIQSGDMIYVNDIHLRQIFGIYTK